MLIGYDIGGTNARACALSDDLDPGPVHRARVREDTTPEGLARTMAELLEALLEEAGAEAEAVEAIGVGIAGQLDLDGRTIVNAPNLGWRDLDFVELLEGALPTSCPIRLANDLSALLWGEHVCGAVTELEDVLAIYVGTGVGGALLAGGQLIEGAGGKAGEIGHVKVDPGGRPCGCGQRGCLEAYAGGVHLERHLATLSVGDPELAAQIIDEDGRVDLAAADALAAENHYLITPVWDRAALELARAIANACTLLNPAGLLLGGGVWEHCADFRERAITRITPMVLEAARRDLSFYSPELGDVAGMIGAADLARSR